MKSVVQVPEHLRGRVIGKGGRTLKQIEQDFGVRMEMQPEGATVEGSEEAINKAKERIQSIIKSCTNLIQKTIQFPLNAYGLVLGTHGKTIKSISSQTNTKIKLDKDGDTALAHISGATEEDCNAAEQKILETASKANRKSVKKTVIIPSEFYHPLIGRNGSLIKSMQRRTNTKIKLERGDDTALAYISGETEEQCAEAEQKILEVLSRPPEQLYRRRFKRLAFVDGAYVGADNEFELQEAQDDYNKLQMYKLIMLETKLPEPQNVEDHPQFKEILLEVLREIHQENQESKNLRTDMWCHFGHVYIRNVDEDDAGNVYRIDDINKNLQRTEDKWMAYFKEGLETLELQELEEVVSGDQNSPRYRVEPNTRFDYTFDCPSGRQIRFKAFALQSSSYPDGISFQKSPLIPIKNALFEPSTDCIKYYLCAPSTVRLKVDIFIPYLKLDCHLVVRTTLKDTLTVRDQEEDEALSSFLDDNLTFKDGKLGFPEEKLPDGFTVSYHRVSKRRTYSYTSPSNVDFNITISEEESRERNTEKDSRTKTDIHLHCDEWDQLLDQEDWEPEAVVSKLPDFLKFVRDVQSNMTMANDE